MIHITLSPSCNCKSSLHANRNWPFSDVFLKGCVCPLCHKDNMQFLVRSIEVLVNSTEEFLFFNLIYFNLRLITLQYCGGFCNIFTWICHGCTYVPHPEPPSHLPPHPIPQGHPSAPALSTLPHASNLDWWSITSDNIHVSMLFSQIIPSSPSPTETKSWLFTSVSLLLSHI